MSIDGKAAQEVAQMLIDHGQRYISAPPGSKRGDAVEDVKAFVSSDHFPAFIELGAKMAELGLHAAQSGKKPTFHDLAHLGLKALGG